MRTDFEEVREARDCYLLCVAAFRGRRTACDLLERSVIARSQQRREYRDVDEPSALLEGVQRRDEQLMKDRGDIDPSARARVEPGELAVRLESGQLPMEAADPLRRRQDRLGRADRVQLYLS